MSSTSNSALSDLDLLELQEGTTPDGRRRLVGVCGVALLTTSDEQRLLIGADVPEALVPALARAGETSPRAPSPDVEPPVIAACRAILASACAPLDLHAVPYYLFEPPVQVEARTPIVRSDAPPDSRLRQLNPGNWGRDEWEGLLDGTLGPWAMALLDDRVVSICHTPRPMTESFAECGVWTHPDYRGRGLAAEVAAAWADVVRPSGRHLFYAHDAENVASRRVAARLGLRPLGRIWRLAKSDPEAHDPLHPLSRRPPEGPATR